MAGTIERGKKSRHQEGRSPAAPGVISLHEIYTITEARARLDWTESALRAAKRCGLKLLTCGKRRYVTGREIVRFLESLSTGPIN